MQFSWFVITLEHTLLMQKGEVQLQGPDKAQGTSNCFSFNYYFIKTLYLLLRIRKISVLSVVFFFFLHKCFLFFFFFNF